MIEQRKNERYETFAKVTIKGIKRKKFVLRDVSVTGCRIECPANAEIMPNMQFSVQITPENDAKIESFFLAVESKWVRVDINICEAGFVIINLPKGKQFQRYVDYLSWRYSHGNSMTGVSDLEPPPLV
jgi:hypothetical protein